MTMIIKKSVILQSQRPIRAIVWQLLDKPENKGFDGKIIAECTNERDAARIAELEAENEQLRHICNLLNEDLYSWAAVELSENSQSCAWKSSMALCKHARALLSPKTGTNA